MKANYILVALFVLFSACVVWLFILINQLEKELRRKQTEAARNARWKNEDETKKANSNEQST